MNFLEKIGKYAVLMKKTFVKPDKWSLFLQSLSREIWQLGVNSISLVLIISVFIGAVITIQVCINTENPLLPKYIPGLTTRDTLLLEFCSSIMSLILAGKVGSNIASEIGTMRITEQIDALEIMGVNSANFIILPKVVGLVLFIPILMIFSMMIGISGGYLATVFTGIIPPSQYLYGIQYDFNSYFIYYSLLKSVVFAFIIASVSSFFGYYANGGSLDVGRSSTNAVVMSSILILVGNVLLTQLMLT